MTKCVFILVMTLLTSHCFGQTKTIKVRKDYGQKLFNDNCSMCHSESDQKLTAPSLIGVTKRLDMAWLIKWTRSSTDLIKSGDKYANEIYRKYGSGQPDFPNLTDDQIKAIYSYVETFKRRAKADVK